MGCPLAAAAFTLTLHTALTKTNQLSQAEPTTTITAYMDDVNILTPHHTTAFRKHKLFVFVVLARFNLLVWFVCEVRSSGGCRISNPPLDTQHSPRNSALDTRHSTLETRVK